MSKKKGEPVRIRVQLRTVPFDMMRYDRACPATEGDAGKLERLSHSREQVEVDFLCFSGGAPSVERWRSFGCTVLGTIENDWSDPKPVRP